MATTTMSENHPSAQVKVLLPPYDKDGQTANAVLFYGGYSRLGKVFSSAQG